MEPWVELLLDGCMIALLAATLFYFRVLNHRIRELQNSKSELGKLLRHFDEATSRATDSVGALQDTSKKIGKTIQMRIEKANIVADELDTLIKRATAMSERMGADINVRRAHTAAERPPSSSWLDEDDLPTPRSSQVRQRPAPEERHIMRAALSEVNEEEAEIMRRDAQQRTLKRRSEDKGNLSSLQAMLEKLSTRAGVQPPSAAPPEIEPPPKSARKPKSRGRSKAEQELIDIIRAGKV